jgi:hypothetical protein
MSGRSVRAAWLARYPTAALAVAFLLLPISIWLSSLLIKPVFIDRYMIPSLLGAAVVIAHFLHHLRDVQQPAIRWYDWPFRVAVGLFGYLSSKTPAGALALSLAFAFPIVFAVARPPAPAPGYNDDTIGYLDLPFVIQYTHELLPRFYYNSAHFERYVYLLDWETAVTPESGTAAPGEYKLMEALLRQFPERFTGRIVNADAFLAAHGRFLVLQADDDKRRVERSVWCSRTSRPWYSLSGMDGYVLCPPQLLEKKILADPRYSIKRVEASSSIQSRVLLVERTADGDR